MKKVAIMTDTVAAIPKDMAQKYSIEVVPFYIIMDGRSCIETDIDKDQLYTRLKQKENLPTTSAPSPQDFLLAYQKLSKNAESILHISMSSAWTNAYAAAIEGKEMAREKLPHTTIEVIDTKTVMCPELLIVLGAAKAAAQGKNLEEVLQLVNDMIHRVNHLSTRDSLFYLDKGGRVFEAKSWAEAESKTIFRAIAAVDASTGGIMKPVARAKTKGQIMKKMVDIIKERVGDKKLHIAIGHSNVPEEAEQFKQMLLSQFQCDELHIVDAAAVIVLYNGRGLIDLGFYSSD